MKKKVYIRADGSFNIGLGHLVRCTALAQMLQEQFDICFFCKEIPSKTINEIEGLKFDVNIIDSEDDFLSVLSGNEIVVLDHYNLGSEYQKVIKDKGCKLVCIDDMNDKVFYADLIINHAPNIHSSAYKAQNYTEYALGLDYSLLRPSFINFCREDIQIIKMDTAFLCFGGADPNDLTLSCLVALSEIKKIKKINVVIGSAYKHRGIFDIASNDQRINVLSNLNESALLQVILKSDFAVVPASTILYEVCSMRLPVLSGYYTENQKLIYDGFKFHKMIFEGGDFSKYNIGLFKKKILECISRKDDCLAIISSQKKMFNNEIKVNITNKFLDLC